MVKEKQMDLVAFENIIKEFASFGELVRTKQREKQTAMDGFDREVGLYRQGKISRSALSAAVPRMNKELQKLDKTIKENINIIGKIAKKAIAFADNQSPNKFKATMSGARSAGFNKSRRKSTRKKR